MPEELTDLIKASGFADIAHFDPSKLVARPEVREMCAANKCNAFDKSWSCPPACGSLESYQEMFTHYRTGYLFQTVTTMEDPFDYASIERGSAKHKQRFNELAKRVSLSKKDILLLGAGACTLCESCTYPDAPCRYPERAFPSMEATGLVVYDVCALTDMPCYHGPNTIAFCSCALE
jgi:predicted metal-binding protein